jgi:flagellar basal body rod protein FlgG
VLVRGADVEIRGDGVVIVDGEVAGELHLVQVEDKSTLLKEGFGRFDASGRTRPAAEGTLRVRQGAVEEANVDALLGMVDLVTIQRAYSANVDALRAMDGVLSAIANEVGKV